MGICLVGNLVKILMVVGIRVLDFLNFVFWIGLVKVGRDVW